VLVVLVDRATVVVAATRATVPEDPHVAELVQRARDDAFATLRAPDEKHGLARRLAHDVDVLDHRLPSILEREHRIRRRTTPHEPRPFPIPASGDRQASVEIVQPHGLTKLDRLRVAMEDYRARHESRLGSPGSFGNVVARP
jgi:hypothetical protein